MPEAEVAPDACRSLWADVVRRALIDALWLAPKAHSATTRQEQSDARRWLRGGRDFVIACTFAGLEPDVVRARVLPLLDAPEDARLRFLAELGAYLREASPQ